LRSRKKGREKLRRKGRRKKSQPEFERNWWRHAGLGEKVAEFEIKSADGG